MLKTVFTALFLGASLLILGSCNKEITQVDLPPFALFPNPCQGVCLVALDPAITTPSPASLHRPNGEVMSQITLMPGQTYQFQLEEDGIHVLEVVINKQSFFGQVINKQP